jgi:hypothetical protein
MLNHSTRKRAVTAAVAIALAGASFISLSGVGQAGPSSFPPITVSKTNAVSNAQHGDSITVSGDGCTQAVANGPSVTVWLAQGAVDNSSPLSTDLVGTGSAGLPDGTGHWSVVFSVQGGGALALDSGTYTLRVGCYANGVSTIDGAALVYAGQLITINGSGEPTTTTTAAPTTTTTVATPPTVQPVQAAPTFTG